MYDLTKKYEDFKTKLQYNPRTGIESCEDGYLDIIPSHLNIQLYVLNGEPEDDPDYERDFTFSLDESFKELIEVSWDNNLQYSFDKDKSNHPNLTHRQDNIGSYSFTSPRDFLGAEPWLQELTTEDNKDYELIGKLHIIDNTNVKYQYACIHFDRKDDNSIFENKLYLYNDEKVHHLKLSLREYYETCLRMYCIENWQLLFIDKSEAAAYGKEMENLVKTYRDLQIAFPEDDLSFIENRLREYGALPNH
ncbi:hypothetical protein OGH69_04125 [Flavobacterium sp. MFBS3-15]|uniref:hypothetical protein n=1 Tax=Flavobacterium sp. MFBS3-15 TaxID=2989816 RepID=UPI0022362F16|nr:hypothetical protein [Flavobacterium sp. MFBS3-15]MCW4468143.1 hypothetical protein [Flavobacterium sp. MFBS3-15]